MAGEPGKADIVNVAVPSITAAGNRRFGIFAARNKAWPIGASTNTATNRLTPPYVTRAPANTTASTDRLGPSFSVMNFAIAVTEPLSSISFPNSAPSRKSGKNCAMKSAAELMKVCVQLARSGSPEKAAAINAATGASPSTDQPR